MVGEWVADILGPGFEQLTLELGADAAPATLVRSLPRMPWLRPLNGVDVLYVHGWSDYFFQTELALLDGPRCAVLRLDLRIRPEPAPGQIPGYVTTLDDYDPDIAAALAAMGTHHRGRRLVLLGHSTGGLTLSLWAARHRGAASAVVLNSPWLELQTGAIGRQAIAPIIAMRARFDPLGAPSRRSRLLHARAARGPCPTVPKAGVPNGAFPPIRGGSPP
jgi:alpha-beta hydrolase superfamily lysophospholipase